MVWIDFRGLGLNDKQIDDLVINKAKLWLDSGRIFGDTGRCFQRVNAACPRKLLETAMKQLEKAIHEALEEKKLQCEDAKADLLNKKSQLDNQRNQAVALINEIRNNEAEYQATLKELDEEEERIQARIVELSRQLAAQQKAARSNPGGYIWPTDSRYITSTVGGRSSPGGVGSTNHKGTDIGRVGYTSEIYAAKSGTVIVSTYNSVRGNYVTISHGSGNTTLYQHLSKRSVSVGDVVKQGDPIGVTGSSGVGSGPHLHFEITENGKLIDPLIYLKDYRT